MWLKAPTQAEHILGEWYSRVMHVTETFGTNHERAVSSLFQRLPDQLTTSMTRHAQHDVMIEVKLFPKLENVFHAVRKFTIFAFLHPSSFNLWKAHQRTATCGRATYATPHRHQMFVTHHPPSSYSHSTTRFTSNAFHCTSSPIIVTHHPPVQELTFSHPFHNRYQQLHINNK